MYINSEMISVLESNLKARYGVEITNGVMEELKKVSAIKVHDTVKIAETSEYYVDGDEYNPKDEAGVVVEIDGCDIYVKWNSGYNVYNSGYNVYKFHDLIKI